MNPFQDNQIQIWQLFQNEPILRYQSKPSDGFGKIVNLFTSTLTKKRDQIVVSTFSGWIFYIGTDREAEKPILNEYRSDEKYINTQSV